MGTSSPNRKSDMPLDEGNTACPIFFLFFSSFFPLFFIYFVLDVCNFARSKAISHLDGKHVVFGELQTGINVLDRMKSVELLEPRSEGKPAPHQRVK